MKKNKLILWGLLDALATAVYAALVALFMSNADRIFGKMEGGPLGMAAFLMLFVLSAAVCGSLILGRPIILYSNNSKKEALVLFGCTLIWLFGLMAVALLFHLFI